ncbi:MAG: tyrosine-type recombinase/integrase [Micropruina sp.]|uniref:tyrosine-type recombinase/integrase n=1 Tax=Micropruina sp. TaxID=2737536 RepID=UPI0039E58E59
MVDEHFQPQREARSFVVWMLARGLSIHTQRVYVGRLARFLSWADRTGVDWREVHLLDLARYKLHLEAGGRSGRTVNAAMITLTTFYRFCSAHGLVDQAAVGRLFEERRLRFLPPGFNPGENGEFTLVRSRTLRAREERLLPMALQEEQVGSLLSFVKRPRDAFLVSLMVSAGMRVGECLGLRREDLHYLPSSAALGCALRGAHTHIVARPNENRARAKGRRTRVVPVDAGVVESYRLYQLEREALSPTGGTSDFVFVNLDGPAAGAPMTYWQARHMVANVGRRAGYELRPHMLRHTAATRWIRSGVDLDVVQALLGHATAQSTAVYLHASDDDMRGAVELVSR